MLSNIEKYAALKYSDRKLKPPGLRVEDSRQQIDGRLPGVNVLGDKTKWCQIECWKKRKTVEQLKDKIENLKNGIVESRQTKFSREELDDVDLDRLRKELKAQIELNDGTEQEMLYFRKEKIRKLKELEDNNRKLRDAISTMAGLVKPESLKQVEVK